MKRARDLNSDDTRILGRPLFAAVALAALFAGSLLACSGDDGGRPGLGEACGEGCADGLTCISGQCSTAPDLGAALDLGPADASATQLLRLTPFVIKQSEKRPFAGAQTAVILPCHKS